MNLGSTVARVAVTGPTEVSAAWERYAELARWSTWAPQIRGVETSGDRLRAGVTGRVQTSVGIGVAFVVTDVDPGRHTWSWLVHVAGRWFTLHHGLVTVAMGTRATLAIEGPAALVLPYAPVARLALRRLVADHSTR